MMCVLSHLNKDYLLTYLLVIFTKTNTLKCTNVASAVKFHTEKVVLLHEHTLRDVYTSRM